MAEETPIHMAAKEQTGREETGKNMSFNSTALVTFLLPLGLPLKGHSAVTSFLRMLSYIHMIMIGSHLGVPPLNAAALGAKLLTHELSEDISDVNTNSVGNQWWEETRNKII